MIRSLALAATLSCALACLSSVAEARPGWHHFPDVGNMVGCSDAVMRPCDNSTAKYNSKYNRRQRTDRAQKIRIRWENPTFKSRPRAWCGWWLGRHLGMPSRSLWRALAWRHVGRSSHGPAVGAIVVWRHHVGIITGRTAGGWVVKSGNDGNAVRERVRSVAGAIAFRWP